MRAQHLVNPDTGKSECKVESSTTDPIFLPPGWLEDGPEVCKRCRRIRAFRKKHPITIAKVLAKMGRGGTVQAGKTGSDKPTFDAEGYKITVDSRGTPGRTNSVRCLLWHGGPKRRPFCVDGGWAKTEEQALTDLREKSKETLRLAQEADRCVEVALLAVQKGEG